MPAPTVDLDGKTYVMTEEETGRLVQSGPVVVLSRREVTEVLDVMKRRMATNWPDAEKLYAEKIKAYETLLGKGDKKAK